MRVQNRTDELFQSWDQESAYIFGFWVADGSIYFKHQPGRKTRKIFKINNTDEQIMKDIALKLGVTYSTSRRPKYPTWKDLHEIRISSESIFDRCFEYTKSTRKGSIDLQMPDIPKNLFRHFIRGFFDGDGSIHVKTYKNRHGKETTALQSSFTAGVESGLFLERLRDSLREHIPVGNKKVSTTVTSIGSNRKLSFNQYDTMLLCQWMYEDGSLFMQRKKAVWDACDKERLANSVRYFSNKV